MTTISPAVQKKVDAFMQHITAKNPGEIEFHQAVKEVAETVMPYIEMHPHYEKDP